MHYYSLYILRHKQVLEILYRQLQQNLDKIDLMNIISHNESRLMNIISHNESRLGQVQVQAIIHLVFL
jgi:hypothetical protein